MPTKSRDAPGARPRIAAGCCGGCAILRRRQMLPRSIAPSPTGRFVALEVDSAGLDAMDRRYLLTIATNYGGGPVGVETMGAALSEPRDAIEDIIEPYLIQCGYLQRTPRGRLLTSHAFRHLGLAEPTRDASQFACSAMKATINAVCR